jgi:Ca2+/Na+ antiporter
VAANEEHDRRISHRLSAFALTVLFVAGIALLVRTIQTGELQFRLLFAMVVVLAIMQALTFRSSSPTDRSGGTGTSM